MSINLLHDILYNKYYALCNFNSDSLAEELRFSTLNPDELFGDSIETLSYDKDAFPSYIQAPDSQVDTIEKKPEINEGNPSPIQSNSQPDFSSSNIFLVQV